MAAELAKLPWLAHLSETVWRNPVTGFVICFLSFDPSIAQQGLFELGLLRQIKRTHPFAASEILQKLPVAMVEGRSQAMTLNVRKRLRAYG